MLNRNIPRRGERVVAKGLGGEFIVVALDETQGLADLMLTTGRHTIEKNVPVNAIQLTRNNVREAAA